MSFTSVPTYRKNHGSYIRDMLSVLMPGDPWMPPGRPRIVTSSTTYTPIETAPHETAGFSPTFLATPSPTVADCACSLDQDHSCSISLLSTCRTNHNRPSSASPENCATSSTNTTRTMLKASFMAMPPISCDMRVSVNTRTKVR